MKKIPFEPAVKTLQKAWSARRRRRADQALARQVRRAKATDIDTVAETDDKSHHARSGFWFV